MEKRYEQYHYSDHDPLIRLGRTARLPFLWGHPYDLNGSTSLVERILNESRAFKIRYGFSVPIHGPMGEFTLLSMITIQGRQVLEELVQDCHNWLWMISPVVCAAASADQALVAIDQVAAA
jgi:hypothetical protein